MWSKDLDFLVLNSIRYLISVNERVSYRNIAKKAWKSTNSVRSIQLSVYRLIDKWKIYKNEKWLIEIINEVVSSNIQTRRIPLIWNIACWWPILADEVVEDYIPVAENMLSKVDDYFLLRTSWDSMNNYKTSINSWDVVLIKQQNIAKNGDVVVALIDNNATLKEFKMEKWLIKLIPHSTNPDNKTIIATDNVIIQWILEKNLGEI